LKLETNLSTRTYVNRRSLYALYSAILAVLLLILGSNVFSSFSGRSQIRMLGERLAEIERAFSESKGGDGYTPQTYKALVDDVSFANAVLKKDAFRWTALLDRLEQLVPKGMIVQGIQPDYKTGGLSLSGMVKTVPDLQQFLDNLAASEDFRDVYLLRQSRAEVDMGGKKMSLISFSVDVKGVF